MENVVCPRADAHRILSERPTRATAEGGAAALVTKHVTRRENARSDQWRPWGPSATQHFPEIIFCHSLKKRARKKKTANRLVQF
jgi:hypothetical protein